MHVSPLACVPIRRLHGQPHARRRQALELPIVRDILAVEGVACLRQCFPVELDLALPRRSSAATVVNYGVSAPGRLSSVEEAGRGVSSAEERPPGALVRGRRAA
jgi:hypothetical protein